MKDFFSDNVEEFNTWFPDGSPNQKIQLMVKQHFMNLAGLELDYYGADSADNTFKVDQVIFKVLEDPNDGYRSMLGAIDYTEEHNSIFFSSPIAKVRIEMYDTRQGDVIADPDEYSFGSTEAEGYRLVDLTDDHIWLEFGTHNCDDYYPVFIFRHHPKK